MKAVVLAGGRGTRLRPLTYTRSKSMLPIANKPILHYIIGSLAAQGFSEVIIATGKSMEKPIMEFFGDGSDYGVKLIYSVESKPLGTAGAVKKAERFLDETFAVIQGDNITEIDLAEEMEFHRDKGGIVTLAVERVKKPWLYGVAELDGRRRVLRFVEKPKPKECFSDLASVGLYVLEPEILDYVPKGKRRDFAKELFPQLLDQATPIYGYETSAFWTDVGVIGGYMEATEWLLSKMPNYISDSADIKGVAINGNVWIEDDVIVKPGTTIVGPAVIEKQARVNSNTHIGPGTVIKNGVEVGSKSSLNGSVVYEGTSLKREAKLQESIIGENCDIGKRVKVDEHAIVGPNCQIGDKTHVCKRSRIWPNIKINPGSIITGIVRKLRR